MPVTDAQVYRYFSVLLMPPAVAMATVTVPDPAGATTVSLVAEITFRWVPALPPNRTEPTLTKFEPVIVTVVPPLCVPAAAPDDELFFLCAALEDGEDPDALLCAKAPPLAICSVARRNATKRLPWLTKLSVARFWRHRVKANHRGKQ